MVSLFRFALLLTACLPVGALARAMVPGDINALAEVSDPKLSPDGADAAYVVTTANLAADKRESHIWLAHWNGQKAARLTGRPGESETHPLFTADGKYVAFLSSRGDAHGNDQIWLLPRAGGEAEKITDLPGGVDDFAIAPDSEHFAVVATDPDPQEDAKTPLPIVIDRFQFKEDIEGYLTARHHHLYLVSRADRKPHRLTTGNFDEMLPAFAPDSKSLAFISKRGADPDRTHNWALYTAETRPGATPKLLSDINRPANDPYWETAPAWSPDGTQIAYLQGAPEKLLEYGVHQLAIVAAAGGAVRLPLPKLDRNVTHPAWAEDGSAINFLLEDDGAVTLQSIDLKTSAVTPLSTGSRTILGVAQAAGHIVAVQSAPTEPGELYAIEPQSFRPLSAQNETFLRDIDLAPVHRISFASGDGTEIHGFLTTPHGVPPASKLPTILRIHGGPQLQFDLSFRPEWQILAGHGYAVVAANPRGGTGRGEAFASAIYADWGNKDAQDVLAAVDFAVTNKVADPAHLGIGGWSYGGMLTNYVIAQDKRFRAAIAGASIGNILAGYGTDEYVHDYEAELGHPWDNLAVWEKISFPFLHNDRITTPTLFLCGDKDFNVPLQNSEQMYQALRSRNIPTELVIYPGEFHGLKRPSFLADRLTRYLVWYDKYVK